MRGITVYQSLSNATNKKVLLIYTQVDKSSPDNKSSSVKPTNYKPTTSYRMFSPYTESKKIQHSFRKLDDIETFAYTCHKDSFIFFARMGKYIVHVDPWFLNSKSCFDNGVRNDTRCVFPESKYGDCLDNAIKAELQRFGIKSKLVY